MDAEAETGHYFLKFPIQSDTDLPKKIPEIMSKICRDLQGFARILDI